jgi:hypothetical protein
MVRRLTHGVTLALAAFHLVAVIDFSFSHEHVWNIEINMSDAVHSHDCGNNEIHPHLDSADVCLACFRQTSHTFYIRLHGVTEEPPTSSAFFDVAHHDVGENIFGSDSDRAPPINLL